MFPEAATPILQDVLLTILGLAGSILTALVGLGSRHLLHWVESKSHSASFTCAIQKIETLTTNAVEEVEQTLVRQLKADKNWNTETAKKARDTAVEISLRHLGPKGLAELQGCLGLESSTIEGMLRTYIEKHVRAAGTTTESAPIVPLGK